ncbi:MAG: DUF1963 domain-containing protein [Ruminococcus sp.]|nr:DUF1963 domain-containing protein [Ruminococcus sp.]
MPDLMSMLKFKGLKYRKMAEELKKYYRNAIVLSVKDMRDNDIPIGASKMGGFPDLPPEIEYPNMSEYTETWLKGNNDGEVEHYEKSAMQLVVQINLYELAESGTDLENLLPKTGMLYIFWSGEIMERESDEWSEIIAEEPDKLAIHKVIYWDGDMSTLKKIEPSCGYYSKYFNRCFSEYVVTFDSDAEYSENSADEIDGLEEATDTDVYDFSNNDDKLFGFPRGANKPDVDENIINLFQFDYQEGCLWKVYWLINKDDLKNLDFSKVSVDFDID